MLVTLDTFQEPMSWLNTEAEENIELMIATRETSQELISELKDVE